MSDSRIVELVALGVLREQCAHCEHDKQFHEGRHCGVCFDYCVYAPAFVPVVRVSGLTPGGSCRE